MGNFETGNVVQEQEDALKNILEYLSKKYGIDYSKKSYSHKECKGSSANTCLLDDSETYNLIGHRDAGYTACP